MSADECDPLSLVAVNGSHPAADPLLLAEGVHLMMLDLGP